MSISRNRKQFDHSGSTFDSFLDEEGVREEVEAVAIKRVFARLTDAQRAELDDRTARNKRNPADVIPWEQVRAGLFKKP
jgi:putative addiction module component (TIGR02574 family)